MHWDEWWTREVSSKGLVFFRWWLGVFLAVYAGLYIPHLSLLFSSEGLVFPLYDQPLPTPRTVYILYAVLMISIVAFTVGKYFRTATVLILLLGLYFWQLQMHLFPASYNRILLLTMLVLLCSGADGRHDRISILPQRLITLQITCTFLGVSLQKWWLPAWDGGEVLAYSLMSRWGTGIAFWYMQLGLPLVVSDVIVFLLKTLQPLTAIGLWIPRFRVFSSIFLIVFLLLVGGLMSIWWFVFLIPAFVLFDEIHS